MLSEFAPVPRSLAAASASARGQQKELGHERGLISRGDPHNYCIVEEVEIDQQVLLVRGCVMGKVLDPCLAEVIASPLQAFEAEAEDPPRGLRMGGMQVQLRFTSDSDIDTGNFEDLRFRYGPDYSDVSILDFCRQSSCEEIVPSLSIDPLQVPAWYGGVTGEESSLSQQLRSVLRQTAKREDGFLQKAAGREVQPAETVPAASVWSSRAAAACTAVEAKHAGVKRLLAGRLRSVQVLQDIWAAGDAAGLVQVLEACGDDSLTAACLNRFVLTPNPLPVQSLARLLPLAQKLSQADCEEHAVAAVRFALHNLRVSWPAIAKLLRSVSTPRVVLESCEEAVLRLQSLYSTVKALSRSVKVSKTSGPLVPLCKKLKVSLEEALVGAGRLRS